MSGQLAAEVQALAASDPELAQLISQFQTKPSGSLAIAIQQKFKEHGFAMPEDYGLDLGDGETGVKRDSYFERNADWMPAVAAGGFTAGAVLPALLGGGAAAAGGGGLIPSTQLGTGMATLPTAASGGAMAAEAAAGGGGGIKELLKKGFNLVGDNKDTFESIADMLGGFSNQTAQNRYLDNQLGIDANNSNIQGRDAYERQLNARAELENQQRKQGLADVYRSGWYQNRKPGPFTPSGSLPQISPQYMDTLGDLEKEAARRLESPAQYSTERMTPINPYEDFQPKGAGIIEQITNYASPILGGLSKMGQPGYPGGPIFEADPLKRIGTQPILPPDKQKVY